MSNTAIMTKRAPKFRIHSTGQAFVEIDGQRIYLGKCDSPVAKSKYQDLLSVWPDLWAVWRWQDELQNHRPFNTLYYPRVPSPARGVLPDLPGVYFVWKGSRVVYVGRASNIRKRCSGPHPQIRKAKTRAEIVPISFILFSDPDSFYAEAFYISQLRPAWNFGRLLKQPVQAG